VVQLNKSRPTTGYKLPRQFNNSDKPGHCSHIFTELLLYMIDLHFWTWNRHIVDDNRPKAKGGLHGQTKLEATIHLSKCACTWG